MAYASNQNDEEKAQPQNAGEPDVNAPVTAASSVGSGATSSKSGNQASSAVAPAPFTNLQSYLNVNAPQIQGTADTVAGQLGNTYNTTKGAIDTAGQNFAGQVASGYAAPDQNVVNQAAANPTDFAKDANNVSAFQKQLNNKYTGPNSFETSSDYTTAQGAAQKAVNQSQNLGKYSGLQSYLTSNVESNPTQAMSALDAALINQNPNAIQTIQNAAKPLNTLGDYLNTTTNTQNSNVSNAQQAAQQAAQFAQNKFTGANGLVPTFENDLTSRLAGASKSASTSANQAKTDLLAGSVTPEDMAILGIQPNQLASLSGAMKTLQGNYGQNFDLENYATIQNPQTVFSNPNAIATADDYAKAAALSKLTGSDLGQYLDQSLAGNAGKQTNSLLSFDKSGAQSDVGNLLKQHDVEYLNTLAHSTLPGNNYTADDILNNVPGLHPGQGIRDMIRAGLKPEEQKKFDSALGRYVGYGVPPTTTTPPVIADPTAPKKPPISTNSGTGIY